MISEKVKVQDPKSCIVSVKIFSLRKRTAAW